MALTANRNVDHFVDQEFRTFKVKGSTTIFKGALVGVTTAGYARGLVAGDCFAGVASESIVNAGADGAKSIRIYTEGDFVHALSGATVASIGQQVFASADDTLTFTATGNSYVGTMIDLHDSAIIILRLDTFHFITAQQVPVKTITHVVENLAAGVDIPARAIHAFGESHWITAVRIVNQATAASGIDDSNTCVVTLAVTAGNVASKTFNTSVTFPLANAVSSLGAITNAHVTTGDVLTLAVTNGAAADPGPFIVEVDYV